MKKEQHRGRKEKNKSEQSGNLQVPHEEYAKIFITEERQILEKANTCMKCLNRFVNGVLFSGKETGKIAASSDEIARRANLIALMAAVEAGRAGKKQTGLSAMAGKTRALAIKSADAVSDTRTHIEHAVTTLESIYDISQLKMASLREKQGVA